MLTVVTNAPYKTQEKSRRIGWYLAPGKGSAGLGGERCRSIGSNHAVRKYKSASSPSLDDDDRESVDPVTAGSGHTTDCVAAWR